MLKENSVKYSDLPIEQRYEVKQSHLKQNLITGEHSDSLNYHVS